MCSIEEAWAGQTFNGLNVQSQADLHRKYMPITNDLLTRNNEFSVLKKEPVSRMDNQGINTKIIRPLANVSPMASNSGIDYSNNYMDVSFSNNYMPNDNYGGLEPRPSYMSIYDNADNKNDKIPSTPMPTLTQAQMGRSAFGDINQAYNVSPVVEKFMAHGNNNTNTLLNEDSHNDLLVLTKKFNSSNANNKNNTDITMDKSLLQIQASLQDILIRLNNVEKELHHKQSNMYDMVLYGLIGMIIAFILYTLLHK